MSALCGLTKIGFLCSQVCPERVGRVSTLWINKDWFSVFSGVS